MRNSSPSPQRAAAEERERAALRRRLTIARKAIQQIAETAIEHQLTDRDWHYWLAEALTLVLTIRDDLPLEGLQAVVAELEQRRADGETALRAAFDSRQNAPAGAIDCTPITTTNQPKADNSATRKIDSEKSRSGRVIRLPLQIRSPPSIHNSRFLPSRRSSSSTSPPS